MSEMTIGKLAKTAGVNIETIRFYEKEGLIFQPKMKPNTGYRKYGPDVLKRIGFIKRTKALGFSLKEIKELISLKAQPNAKGGAVKEKVGIKIEEIEAKISELLSIKEALERLSNKCGGDMSISECPILIDLYESNSKKPKEGKCCQ